MAILLGISAVALVADARSSVHYHVATTVGTARIESAGVNALLIEASFVVRTFRVLSTL